MHPSLKHELSNELGCQVGELRVSAVSGGDINQAYKVEGNGRTVFAKVNAADAFPGMFEAERSGLELLNQSPFRVPRTHRVVEADNNAMLVMEWIDTGPKSSEYWRQLGRNLAKLHQQTSDAFGLDHDNYIGSLPQSNARNGSWMEFFVECRIVPQMEMAISNGLLIQTDLERFLSLQPRLSESFPDEPPALLHGDLWSGNVMCDASGNPVIIDPAMYYGHRLMDVGMTMLFGGFDAEMYAAYNDVYPLPKHWKQACGVANLYPLLVHVNLFGRSYVSQVKQMLQDF